MIIRDATIADIPLIKALAERIWPVAYSDIISAGQIRYMLDLIYNPEALQRQLEIGHRFIISERESVPCGFASYSPKSAEDPATYRLHKLYVLQEPGFKGTGSLLLEKVKQRALEGHAKYLELNVNKQNTAKFFYEKKGFENIAEEVIDIGEGFVMDDFIMLLTLNT